MEDESIPQVEILAYRLITGEDIISQGVLISPEEEGDEPPFWVLIEPRKIVYYVENESQTYQVGLMPWIFSQVSKDVEYKLYMQDIMTTFTPTDQIVKSYVDIIGNNLLADGEYEILNELSDLETLDNVEDESITNYVSDYLDNISKKTLH